MDHEFVPAGPPPPGVVPNLEHPDSYASVAVGTMSTLVVVTVIAMTTRLFTKFYIIGKVAFDDCAHLSQALT